MVTPTFKPIKAARRSQMVSCSRVAAVGYMGTYLATWGIPMHKLDTCIFLVVCPFLTECILQGGMQGWSCTPFLAAYGATSMGSAGYEVLGLEGLPARSLSMGAGRAMQMAVLGCWPCQAAGHTVQPATPGCGPRRAAGRVGMLAASLAPGGRGRTATR
ncbi:hypothetical protein Dimus_021984, partial [Dionaea muscipula]